VARTVEWIAGARPRTLPAAIAPVAVGTGLAIGADAFLPVRALLALLVAIALQVGVNYANDYSDGIRGTDEKRVGPVRLVGQGLASPVAVKRAAILWFAVAAVAGLALVILTERWWLLLIGLASIAAAWLYTGGPRPYGYAGLGEVFVFIFFGIVPVVGTFYVQSLTITPNSVIAAVGVGALACAILVSNNLRDIPTDTQHGKRTLAVRLGDARTRSLYLALLVVAAAVVVTLAFTQTAWALLALISAPLTGGPVRAITSGAVGPALIVVLKGTGLVLLVYGITLGVGLALG
jgi:1,4-dihydroxy-2-naphthoate octaprenyltransferase